MKKFSIILSMLILTSISLSACSGSGTDVQQGVSNQGYSDVSVIEEEIIEAYDYSAGDCSYKMSKIYNVPKGGEYDYQHLSFVIELEGTNYSLGDFSITHKGTGEDLLYGSNYKTFIYEGYICEEDNHIFEDGYVELNKDRQLYTFDVVNKSNEELNFDDIEVSAYCAFYTDGGENPLVNVSFDYNATIEDITTSQSVVHGNTLVKLDDAYYVYCSEDGGSGGNGIYEYNVLKFKNLQDREDGKIELKGNFNFVDRVSGVDVPLPSGYEIYYDSEVSRTEAEIDIGINSITGEKMSTEVDEKLQDMLFKYTLEGSNDFIIFT